MYRRAPRPTRRRGKVAKRVGRRWRAAMVAGVATSAMAAGAATEAQAVPVGDGVPEGQISIQMYSFNSYIGNSSTRLNEVLAELKAAGYSAVEPYGEGYGISAAQFRAALDANDLRAVGRH